MKIIHLLFAFILLASCNNQKKTKSENDTQTTEVKNISTVICYQYANAGDTVFMKVIANGKTVTGNLDYSLKEKDRNKGTINGAMHDNILLADYTFMSEGMQSVRQVAFKLEENTFTEGYGEVINENEKVRFKNIDSLVFNSMIRLEKVECKE